MAALRGLAVILSLLLHAGQAGAGPARELHIPLPAAQVSLDPTAVQDQSSLWVSRQLNCQLVRLKQGKVMEEAIDSYRFLSPTQIEMVLSSRYRFQDGSPILAEDVVATFDYLKKGRSVLRNVFEWVDRVQIAGPKKVLFHLKHPSPHFLKALSAPNQAVMKKSFLEKVQADPSLWRYPVGCGAYRVESFGEQTIRLAPVQPGALPVIFHLRAGKPVGPEDLNQFDIVGLSLAPSQPSAAGFRVEKTFDPYHLFLGLNTRLPQWRDREARCRLFASLDRKPVLDRYGSEGEPAKDLVPRGVLGFVPTVDYYADLHKRYLTHLPAVPIACMGILSVSVPVDKRSAYVQMLSNGPQPPEVKVIEQPKHFGPQFQSWKCDALVLGLKSNYLDAYEYILLFSEKDANFTGYWDEELRQKIVASQAEEDTTKKAYLYQEILGRLRDECLIYPVVTVPLRSTFVRSERKTPGIGTTSLNEYALAEVR